MQTFTAVAVLMAGGVGLAVAARALRMPSAAAPVLAGMAVAPTAAQRALLLRRIARAGAMTLRCAG